MHFSVRNRCGGLFVGSSGIDEMPLIRTPPVSALSASLATMQTLFAVNLVLLTAHFRQRGARMRTMSPGGG